MAKELTTKIAVLSLLLITTPVWGTKPTPSKKPDPKVFSHDHASFTTELKKFVKMDGPRSTVDYKAWKKDRKLIGLTIETHFKLKGYPSWPMSGR